MIHEVRSTEEINKILGIEKMVVILNFHSETCGPCVMQMPILEDLSNNFKVTLLTFNVEIDKDNTLDKFGIAATPTTKIYKDGKMLFTHSGFMPYEEWKTELSKYL